MRKLKLYLDTSVWNFVFADDAPEKKEITVDFFKAVEKEIYEIFISEVVVREINVAPELKRKKLFELIRKYTPVELEINEEVDELTEFYMKRELVPIKKRNDAFHVAVAVVFELDAVVTWNFSHLANLRKEELFNGVNLEKGYTKRIDLVTPMEVSSYES